MTTDNNIYFRRPETMDVYAILSPARVAQLRKRKKLDSWLQEQRDSGVIIQTAEKRFNTSQPKIALPSPKTAYKLGYAAAEERFSSNCNPWSNDDDAAVQKSAWSRGHADFFSGEYNP